MALTNDDLLAISHLLDVKLKAEIQPIKNEIQSLKTELKTTKAELHSEIQSVKAELHSEIQSVKAELHGEIQSVKAELHAEIHQIKLFQENVIMPQLNTIQSCYTSTYDRYRDSVEGYERLQADSELMQQIITEHSKQLQKLA